MRLRQIHHWALLLLPTTMAAQDCTIPFIQPLFTVQAEPNLWYGNATRFNGGTDSLRLNLFKPVGDGQTERPLVIAIHGGGFTGGNRNELNDYCNTLASMGWSCATISYRLGFYGTGVVEPPYAYDPNEVRRAMYRAMQDAKGAIRFMKERHIQDSTSTSNVLLVGFSAGAITALHAAHLDRPEEKPAGANAIGEVQHFLNFYPRPDLGNVEGDLNLQNGHDATVLGVVNIFGGVLDTTYIESADGPALYSYHQTLDPVVGCGFQRPYWGVGLGVPDNYPYMYGSCAIDPRVQGLAFAPGRYQFTLHQGNEHDIHDPVGILVESLQWMRDLFCSATTSTGPMTPEASIRVYPNPATDVLRIERSQGEGPIPFEVFDTRGRSVRSGTLNTDVHVIDLSGMPEGLYVLRASTQGRELNERFVIER